MHGARVTVVVPTLRGGEPLERAIACLGQQTFTDFVTVIVDNSASGLAQGLHAPPEVIVIENDRNVGFGEAINQGLAESDGEYICSLNDDAYVCPNWLEDLVCTADADPETIGMCASQIRLADDAALLDSAGLDIYPDGTTKQRGNREATDAYSLPTQVLLPSGCAALYRRKMIEQVGAFDGSYFLYCEDTDLGLRGRLAGWTCRYVPSAVVEHDYSRSSGRASATKAFYVERNRLFTVIKTFPVILWPFTPLFAVWRYAAHAFAGASGRGLAGDIQREQGIISLVKIVLSAHWQVLTAFPRLWRARQSVRARTTLGTWSFIQLLRRYSVSAWKIASQ